jgi:hypothetical protein
MKKIAMRADKAPPLAMSKIRPWIDPQALRVRKITRKRACVSGVDPVQ